MQKGKRICAENQLLFSIFLTVKDPRVGGRTRYPLISLIYLRLHYAP